MLTFKWYKIWIILIKNVGLPWWSRLRSALQCKDTGSIPSPGRLHMPWGSWAYVPQLPNPCARPTEIQAPKSLFLQQERPLQWEALTPQPESNPCMPQIKKAHIATRTQYSQK